jgi:hypothetical protein
MRRKSISADFLADLKAQIREADAEKNARWQNHAPDKDAYLRDALREALNQVHRGFTQGEIERRLREKRVTHRLST